MSQIPIFLKGVYKIVMVLMFFICTYSLYLRLQLSKTLGTFNAYVQRPTCKPRVSYTRPQDTSRGGPWILFLISRKGKLSLSEFLHFTTQKAQQKTSKVPVQHCEVSTSQGDGTFSWQAVTSFLQCQEPLERSLLLSSR